MLCPLESRYYLPGNSSYVVSNGVKVLSTWAIVINHLYGNNSYVVSTGVKVLSKELLLCSVNWSQSIILPGL